MTSRVSTGQMFMDAIAKKQETKAQPEYKTQRERDEAELSARQLKTKRKEEDERVPAPPMIRVSGRVLCVELSCNDLLAYCYGCIARGRKNAQALGTKLHE